MHRAPSSDAPTTDIDVRSIRAMLNLTRAEFAIRYGFRCELVAAWEAGEKNPTGPARTLLILLDRIPDEINLALFVN